MRTHLIRLMLILLFFSCTNTSFAFAPSDIFSYTRIAYVNPTPDGKAAAVTTMKAEQKEGKWQWKYELFYSENGHTTPLTTDNTITQATWSNDGKFIAYISRNNSATTIYLLKIANKQKSKLTEFKGSIDALQWSPDNKTIAFVGTPKSEPKMENGMIDVNLQNPNSRLYLVAVGLDQTPKPITPADDSISIGFNDKGFDWSPNGVSIAFSSQPDAGAHYAGRSKIYIYNVATGRITTTSYLQTHYANQPLFSPDSRYLAFRTNPATTETETVLKNNLFNYNQICVTDLRKLQDKCLADTDNQNATLIGWNAKSNTLYAMDFYKTDGERIYALSLDPATPATMISTINGFIDPLSITLNAHHNTFGFGYENLTTPQEAFLSRTDHFKLIPLTKLNKPAPDLGNAQDINWRSTDGKKIEGLLFTPHNYDPLRKYPMVVWVHGGPIGAAWKRYLGGCDEYAGMIDPGSCFINYLNAGYVVFAPNYRGSTGYGTDFRLANYRDFGGNDYQDIQSGVDYLIAKGIADADNLFMVGWSYGGYLTSWTITQTPRYKAAVSGDGLTNLLSFSGTTDIPFYTSVYLGTYFWDDSFLYVKRSPIMYVKNIQTPLLLFSGQRDIRVPIEQSIEMYTALKSLNKRVAMYVLPEQGHVPQDPNLALSATIEINRWFSAALGRHGK